MKKFSKHPMLFLGFCSFVFGMVSCAPAPNAQQQVGGAFTRVGDAIGGFVGGIGTPVQQQRQQEYQRQRQQYQQARSQQYQPQYQPQYTRPSY